MSKSEALKQLHTSHREDELGLPIQVVPQKRGAIDKETGASLDWQDARWRLDVRGRKMVFW